jgi:hypothetical protein
MELVDPVPFSFNVVTNSLVKTTFSLVRNGSRVNETCCGFSLMVEAKLLTSKWLLTRARLLFGCEEYSSSIVDSRGDGILSERLSDLDFFYEEF